MYNICMSVYELGYNKNSLAGSTLSENVLKSDDINRAVAQSVNRAVINHFVYFLRKYFANIVFKHSAYSSGTTLTIRGKYPESFAFNDYPICVVYSKEYGTEQMFMGDIHFNLNGEEVHSRYGNFQVTFDCWGRTQEEIETITGSLARTFDGLNNDVDFIKRGFDTLKYRATLGREFDITDKIVETVSHLDTAINVRREQIVYDVSFFYKIRLPIIPTEVAYVEGGVTPSIVWQGSTATVNIVPSIRRKYFETKIVGAN